MNNKRVFLATLAFSSVFLGACGSTIPTLKPYHVEVQQGNVLDEKMMAQLHPGMTKSQVRYILGTPLIQDDFHQKRWDYFYQIRQDGKVVDRRSVILDFEGDLLKGIRGDVIPASQATSEADSSMVTLSNQRQSAPKQGEEKSFWNHLKFWDADEQPKAKVQPSKPAVESKPEESKKSFWNRFKFWEDEDKPTPKADKSSDATSVLLKSTALAHERLAISQVASEIADTAQQKVEVISAVNTWGDAWRNKDLKAYFLAYSAQFVPDGVSSKKVWIAQRKQRILQAGAIKLDLENLNVALTNQLATVTFDQIYSTSKFKDHIAKTLQLAYVDNRWLIVKEFVGDAKSVKKVDTVGSVGVVSAESSSETQAVATHIEAPVSSVVALDAKKELKSEASKTESAQLETNATADEPNLFERMLERIGF